ncbi:MAG TPA: SDR family NAD(P)-dependent oxidoreductase, partial [Acidimicrobiales bacterium]
MRLEGRVALVTGAGNGIGKACALELAKHGATVVVNDLGTDEFGKGRASRAADQTVAEIQAAGGRASANHDSVADSAGCERAVRQAVDEFGKLDIVVACAGALLEGSLEATDDEYQRFLDLFLSQKFWLARAAVPAMAERGWGRLVTTTSHGATGLLGKPIFAAAMGGVISMTKAIAHEYRGRGVTANCLAPGAATRLHALSHERFQQMHAEGLITDEDWERYLTTPPPEYVAPI